MANGKTGNTSWKPAPGLFEIEPPKGFRRRFVNGADLLNIARKKAQGWVIEEKPVEIQGVTTANGANEYRELVSMLMPEELAQARAEYYENLTEERSLTPAIRAKKDMPEHAEFIYDVNN